MCIRDRGHTDNTGDAAMNEKLSIARAEAVKARLESAGIDASRISATGYGSATRLKSPTILLKAEQ